MNLSTAELLPLIQDALSTIPPRQLTDAEEKDFRGVLKRLEKLATTLREPPDEEPDPLAAGARLHELTVQEVERSGAEYVAALRTVCTRPENLDVVLAYQNLGKKR